MKSAVVTGASGFVGSAVVKELSKKKIYVYAVVRKKSSNTEELKQLHNVEIVYCDASEYKVLAEKIPYLSDGCFFHFAWEGASGTKRGDEKIQLRNVQYAIDAVREAKKIGCNRFIFASSIMEKEIEAYIETEKKLSINNLYSSAKSTADQMCRIFADTLSIDYLSIMISNIYGPGENSARLINTSIRKLLAGEHISFSAGNQQYDFIYIDDAAKSFVAVAEKGINRKVYYLGSQRTRVLKDYLLEMRDIVSPKTELGLGELEFNGISLDYCKFDRSAIERDTGYKLETPFDEGICRTVNWIKENG